MAEAAELGMHKEPLVEKRQLVRIPPSILVDGHGAHQPAMLPAYHAAAVLNALGDDPEGLGVVHSTHAIFGVHDPEKVTNLW
jgi:hypothetical protein